MKVKGKHLRFVGIGMAGLAMAAFIAVVAINRRYGKGIPDYPDSTELSVAIKDQLRVADEKARQKPSAKNLGDLGMVYHSSSNYTRASQCYQLAIKKKQSDWQWSYYLGYLNLELGNADQVVENYNTVIEMNPNLDMAYYYLGEAHRNRGENDLAEKVFSRIIDTKKTSTATEATRKDHFPLRDYAMFQLSKIYFDSGRTDLAEKTLLNLLKQNDVFGPAFRLLGTIYKLKGDLAQGEEYTVRANDLYPLTPPVDTLIDRLALMSRSELYLLKKIDEAKFNGYSDWAVTLVKQGLDYMPDNENLVSKAITVYLSENMMQEAARLKDKHLNAFIDNYPELVSFGMYFYRKGMYEEARQYWTKALELKTEGFEFYKYYALCCLKMGEDQQARDILTRGAEEYQENPEVLAELILVFLQSEYFEEAAVYLNRLNQNSSALPEVQKLYGRIAEMNGNFLAAISRYESSFDGDPHDLETIQSLGGLLIREKRWDKYITFYKSADKLNPNNPEFLEKLSTMLIHCPDESQRDLDQGIKYSIRAFTHINSPPDIVLSSGKNLALALAMIGDKQNALRIIEKTIQIIQQTDDPEAIQRELEQLYRNIQNTTG